MFRLSVSLAVAGLILAPAATGCSSSSGGGAPDAEADTHVGKGDAGTSDAPRGDGSKGDASKGDASKGDASKTGDAPGHDAPVVTDAGDSSVTGAPSLTALSVTATIPSDASAGLTLVPPFSPSVHDYYVRCGAGSNALTVSMTASTGAESALSKPTASASAPTQTVPVSATENEAIVAVATLGTASTEYWVRCLPHDFPQLEMTLHPDAGAPPTAGYYLLGNLQAKVSGGYAMALDGNGVPVWYHAMGAHLGVVDVDNVVPGAISFIPFSLTQEELFEIHHLNPASTATLTPSGYTTDLHELRLLPNGNFILLSYPLKSGVDLTGLSIPSKVDGGMADNLGPNSTIQDCAALEVTPTGSVVRSWLASDHFDAKSVSTLPLTGFGAGSTIDGGTVYDVFHCNSVDVDPANGNLLMSAREMDSVFYVEWSTGKVLWKMGGVDSSKDNTTFVAVADPFFREHDARLQPGWSSSCNGGSGQVSMFDDESGKPGPARGVVYDVAVGGPDGGTEACDGGTHLDGGTSGHATVAWQYKGLISSAATGSMRISSDGSRVIDWGLGGTPDRVFTEVDLAGNDLLEFRFTDGNSSYRAIKVPLSAFSLADLRNTAGTP